MTKNKTLWCLINHRYPDEPMIDDTGCAAVFDTEDEARTNAPYWGDSRTVRVRRCTVRVLPLPPAVGGKVRK